MLIHLFLFYVAVLTSHTMSCLIYIAALLKFCVGVRPSLFSYGNGSVHGLLGRAMTGIWLKWYIRRYISFYWPLPEHHDVMTKSSSSQKVGCFFCGKCFICTCILLLLFTLHVYCICLLGSEKNVVADQWPSNGNNKKNPKYTEPWSRYVVLDGHQAATKKKIIREIHVTFSIKTRALPSLRPSSSNKPGKYPGFWYFFYK